MHWRLGDCLQSGLKLKRIIFEELSKITNIFDTVEIMNDGTVHQVKSKDSEIDKNKFILEFKGLFPKKQIYKRKLHKIDFDFFYMINAPLLFATQGTISTFASILSDAKYILCSGSINKILINEKNKIFKSYCII